MPQVTWRGGTAFGPWCKDNNDIARELHMDLLTDPSDNHLELGFADVFQLTEDLWSVNKWVLEYGGELDLKRFVSKTAEGIDAVKMQAALDINFRLSVGLENELSTVKVRPVYMDHAHPQPWVYNEINNAFLNSICHHV